jgi:hypothetical protein
MEAYTLLKSLGRKRCATCIAPARSLSYYKVAMMRCWSLILENRNGIYISFFSCLFMPDDAVTNLRQL